MEIEHNWMDITDNELGIHDPFDLSLESPMDLYPNSFENITQSSFGSTPFYYHQPLNQPTLQFPPLPPQQNFIPVKKEFEEIPQFQQQLFIQSQQMQPLQQPYFQSLPLQQLPPQKQLSTAVKNEHQFDEIHSSDEDALVALDSDTFQDYVNRLRQHRTLTRNEEASFKKIFKKIKNRESARKSRQAKKEISQELDEQVHVLSQKTQSLKLEVSALTAINQQIRNEISFSEKLIASNPFLSKLYQKACGELNKSDSMKVQIPENTQTRCTFRSTTDFVSNKGVTVNS